MLSQRFSLIFLIFLIIPNVLLLPQQGIFHFEMNQNNQIKGMPTTLFAGSKIFVKILCESKNQDTIIRIVWTLTQRRCLQEDLDAMGLPVVRNNTFEISQVQVEKCVSHFIRLDDYQYAEGGMKTCPTSRSRTSRSIRSKREDKKAVVVPTKKGKTAAQPGKTPIYIIEKDGLYNFKLEIESCNYDFNASVTVELQGVHGYLSAADWPFLPFYGAMCLVYVILGIIWLAVSFMQWRDLLRIQFWIGGVILLGMLEKAVFYAEYQSINSTGRSVQGAVLVAEWVSCAKRTLARMLVIIVSLGFGIVKPRLGPMLHRVVGTGVLYFILACVESYLRVIPEKNDQSNQGLVASIPLAVLDSAICWWIFTSLVQTTRTLRLRRNMVKLSLYRHFTNTLIFSVFASVIFMLYSIKTHQLTQCSSDWKDIWIDEAFWHILFSVLLLVIMILWRPTNNNQRYAFTPLLDNPEDEDDEEEDQFVSDAYGVKMRGSHQNLNKPQTSKATTSEEDDLRWVEENIPSAIADAALPVLDSDEEIINTKFEVSKMQ